jgi:hypothetical protein
MPGNDHGDGDGDNGYESDDSWIAGGDEAITKQTPMVFTDLKAAYAAASEPRRLAEKALSDAIQRKVDSIVALIQKHAALTIADASRSSSSTVVNSPQQMQDVIKELDDFITDIRRQYITSARNKEDVMSTSNHVMFATVLRLLKALKGSAYDNYAKILDDFYQNELVGNWSRISAGDSKDPFLHYLFDHPEAKHILSEELVKDYTHALDEHFIMNNQDTLRSLELITTGIQDLLESKVGTNVAAMRIELARGRDARAAVTTPTAAYSTPSRKI